MATKAQWQRKLLKEVFSNTTGSTADRDTEADDIQVNDHAWKLSNAHLSLRWVKMRADCVG